MGEIKSVSELYVKEILDPIDFIKLVGGNVNE